MELLQLRYFKSVARHENITKAAQELHISQPSLSITIKRLEEELSVPLFNRKGKSIELNIYGKVFLNHVNSILNSIDSAKEEILELYGYKNTHLSLAATSSLFLSGVLKDFLILNPDIKITQSINNENILEKLKDRSIDFAITSPLIADPMIETIELLAEDIVAVMPKHHRLANEKEIYLEELKNDGFMRVTESDDFYAISKSLFENAGFSPNVIFEGEFNILSELLELKKAVAITTISVCLYSRNDMYTLVRLKDNFIKRKIGISFIKGAHLSETAKRFKDFIIDYYKNYWFTLENYKKVKSENENLNSSNRKM